MFNIENLKSADGLYPEDIADIILCADEHKRPILRQVGRMIISHRRYLEGWNWLSSILEEHGTGLEGTCGLLTGEPGVGKSTILKQFVKKFGGPYNTANGTKRPVVRVVTPPKPTEERLLKAMLDAFGVPELAIGRPPDLKRVVVRQIEIQDIKLLIFDEFTHLLEDRSEVFAAKGFREMKSLLSEGLCQIAFAGTPELEKIRTVYTQLKRRSAGDYILSAFDWSHDDDKQEWAYILGMINEALPMRPAFGLADGSMPYKVHRATLGNLDNLIKLLFRATSIAYDDGDDDLKLDVLSEAFERMRRGSTVDNPFGDARKRIHKPEFIHDEDDEDEVTGLRNMPRQPRDSFSTRQG